MSFFRIIFKLISLVCLALIAVPITLFYTLSSKEVSSNNNIKTSPNEKQKIYRKKWLNMVVKVLGLELELKGNYPKFETAQTQSALWVANHISWMDIVVVGSQGVGFLSKSEIRKWPLIGWLGEKSGTIFIDRGGKNASQVAAKAISEKIHAGDNILVFPEATTTSGESVKRFHARIFAPALDHDLLVQPIVIQYLDENNQIHPKSSWNDQSFMSNLVGVLAQPSIRVVLTYLPIIEAKQYSERRVLAEFVENQIRDIVLSTTAINIA